MKKERYLGIVLAIFLTALIGIFFPKSLLYIAIVAFLLLLFLVFTIRKDSFFPQSQEYKELERIKKRRKKQEDKKHKTIVDQFKYIELHWGYTKTQSKVIEQILTTRAYKSIYRKLTIAILPQLIELIDKCNNKEKKACKQEINKRLNELASLLKETIKQQKQRAKEEYEVSLEVLDRFFKEFKN